MRPLPCGLLAGVCCLGLCGEGRAASRTLRAGDVLGIAEDLVLSGDDVLEVRGTPEQPCRIDANGQQIRTQGDWTGWVKVAHCEFRGLGSARKAALDLNATGDGDRIVIEHSTFHACGAVHLANAGNSATVFRRNTLRATALVPVTNLP